MNRKIERMQDVEHKDLCCISHSMVQEDGKQRIEKWISLGKPHVVLRFSEAAGPCRSAERAGRLNEGPGLTEKVSEYAAFKIGLELRQELNSCLSDTTA